MDFIISVALLTRKINLGLLPICTLNIVAFVAFAQYYKITKSSILNTVNTHLNFNLQSSFSQNFRFLYSLMDAVGEEDVCLVHSRGCLA